jgi:hypothetical protein
MEKVTVVVGLPIISKLVRGYTVELDELILIPDYQLSNESKDMGCCVQFKEPIVPTNTGPDIEIT